LKCYILGNSTTPSVEKHLKSSYQMRMHNSCVVQEGVLRK
ncbi:unnamed protein product, partial [Brassica oleracea]